MNTYAKGYRHEKKTVDYFAPEFPEGSVVRVREAGGRRGKQDLLGADILIVSHGRVVAIQVKANKGHIRKGMAALAGKGWPEAAVVHWPPRAREPQIFWLTEQERDNGGTIAKRRKL